MARLIWNARCLLFSLSAYSHGAVAMLLFFRVFSIFLFVSRMAVSRSTQPSCDLRILISTGDELDERKILQIK